MKFFIIYNKERQIPVKVKGQNREKIIKNLDEMILNINRKGFNMRYKEISEKEFREFKIPKNV